MSAFALQLVLGLSFLNNLAIADNGMDMSMDGAMSLSSAHMLPYLHFTRGDTIWFLGWAPQSSGAMVGACIGLFLLALVDRWLVAVRATADSYWRQRSQVVASNKLNSVKTEGVTKAMLTRALPFRSIPPFILAHDVARGVLHAGQMALSFAFMLVVMTYQATFIISIVIGLGVGETLFGRYASAAASH